MTRLFEELGYRETAMGELVLRRRRILSLEEDVLEVKLGEEFLMSSLFTEGERALARLGLGKAEGDQLEVAVGGLGLGYTAAEALEDLRVRRLVVIEALEAVIDWHGQGLIPLGAKLLSDPRCELRLDDFFAVMDGNPRTESFDAILLDIDHSPRALLSSRHRDFYTADGLRRMSRRLKENGVFAMWSDAPPDGEFMRALAEVFQSSSAEVVRFPNPLQGNLASCTIYLGRLGAGEPSNAEVSVS